MNGIQEQQQQQEEEEEEEERSISSFLLEYEDLGDDHNIRVQVESSVQKTTFYVPVATMLKRELEMRETAILNLVSTDNWSHSRLYTLWKARPKAELGEEISLSLDPESAIRDYCDVQWKPWMTSCIREFYHFGSIRVPEDCLGSDIILALEYFGIITSSPETFTFETPQTLGRIKAWSAYLTHRHSMAEHVVSEHRISPENSLIWATTPDPGEAIDSGSVLNVTGGTAATFGRETPHQQTDSSNEHLPSCRLVHYLFFDNDSASRVSQETPVRIRRDFCEYVQRMLEGVDVSFDLERVKITKIQEDEVTTVLRAVLRVEPQDSSTTEVTTPGRHKLVINSSISDWSDIRQSCLLETDESACHGRDFTSRASDAKEETESQWLMLQTESHATEGPHEVHMAPLEERRYPNATPAARRLFPEAMYEDRTDTVFAPNTEPTKSAHCGDGRVAATCSTMPVHFIDTDFGDLQSVLSGLSDPKMDDSTVNTEFSESFFRKARNIGASRIHESSNTIVPELEVAINVEIDEGCSKSITLPNPISQDAGIVVEDALKVEGATEETGEGQELVYMNEDFGICNFLHGFLESICPVLSVDPTTKVQQPPSMIEMRKDVVNEADIRLNFPIDGRENEGCLSEYPISCTGVFPSEVTISRTAKSMGRSLAEHLDEMSKCGYEEFGDEQPDEIQDSRWRHTSRSTRVQHEDELRYLDRGNSSQTVSKSDAQLQSELHARRASQQLDGRWNRPMTANYCHAPDAYHIAPNSIARQAPARNGRRTELPPREPRNRVRVKENQKPGIARKKHTTQSGLASQKGHAFQLKSKPQATLPVVYEESGRKGLVL